MITYSDIFPIYMGVTECIHQYKPLYMYYSTTQYYYSGVGDPLPYCGLMYSVHCTCMGDYTHYNHYNYSD